MILSSSFDVDPIDRLVVVPTDVACLCVEVEVGLMRRCELKLPTGSL